jgi:hypothetical protein
MSHSCRSIVTGDFKNSAAMGDNSDRPCTLCINEQIKKYKEEEKIIEMKKNIKGIVKCQTFDEQLWRVIGKSKSNSNSLATCHIVYTEKGVNPLDCVDNLFDSVASVTLLAWFKTGDNNHINAYKNTVLTNVP